MRNRQFEFEAKTQYARAASLCEAASEHLRFPVWCRILELVRTSRAAGGGGGAANPPQKMQAAKPHRSKTAKEPEKNIGANHSHSVRAQPALNLFREKENFLSYRWSYDFVLAC